MRLKKRLSALLCAALAAVIALSGAVAAFAAIYTRVVGTSYYGTSYQVVQLVNRERKAAGLPALGVDEELTNAAVRRAAEISILFDHVRPNGQMCFTVSNKMYGENIAYGYGYGAGSAEQVMEQWMASPGHRENILREEFKSIGVGCFEIDGVYYWAQAFGYAGASGSPRTSGSMEVGYDVELAIAPLTPENFNVYARGGNGTDLYLEWGDTGAEQYRVYIYSGTPGTSSYRETLKGTTTENRFVFTDLVPGWEYNVMVVAANEYGSASSKTAICAAPARIESFYADAKSSGRIEAGWSTAACHGYLIQWSRDESFSRVDGSAVINGTNTTRCTINVSGAADYYVRVRAWRNYNGDKVYSEFTAPVKAG